jgi:ArsR family transcriptional regulator, arsenate/arsenite/antimonite-responsive transcriptional repressor
MLDLKPSTGELQQLAEQLKVVAEPNRLRILQTLMEGFQCNCELGDMLEMPPNLISHHLRVLRQAGLVEMERDQQDARWVYYSINIAAMQQLSAAFGAFFDAECVQPRRNTCGPNSAGKVTVDFLSV